MAPESPGGERREAAHVGVLSVPCTWQRGETRTCPAWVCGAREGEACNLPDLFTYDSLRAVLVRAEGQPTHAVLVHETRYREAMR